MSLLLRYRPCSSLSALRQGGHQCSRELVGGTMRGGFLLRVQGNTGMLHALRNLARIGCAEAAEQYDTAFLDVITELRHDHIILKDDIKEYRLLCVSPYLGSKMRRCESMGS